MIDLRLYKLIDRENRPVVCLDGNHTPLLTIYSNKRILFHNSSSFPEKEGESLY